jgi:hypothetical protein
VVPADSSNLHKQMRSGHHNRKGRNSKNPLPMENFAISDEERSKYSEGNGIFFTVEVAKKPKTLSNKEILMRPFTQAESSAFERIRISCVAAHEVHILHVQHLPVDAVVSDKSLYSGVGLRMRVFVGMYAEWKKYLESKGVDDIFSNFVVGMATEKEGQEYFRWLERVHDLASS